MHVPGPGLERKGQGMLSSSSSLLSPGQNADGMDGAAAAILDCELKVSFIQKFWKVFSVCPCRYFVEVCFSGSGLHFLDLYYYC